MVSVYRNQQLRQLEAQLYAVGECTATQLMENAGHAAFKTLLVHWPTAQRIIIVCGKGNNGGDGLVIARLAHEFGLQVEVYSDATAQDYSDEAKQALAAAKKVGLSVQPYPSVMSFFQADVIVDALLGSGLQGAVRESYAEIINAINASSIPVLAIDVPSGLHADSGQMLGCAIHADVTITFIALKQGLLTGDAVSCCGNIVCDPIGVPDHAFAPLAPSVHQLNWNTLKSRLPKRLRAAHKGDYGHVLVVGGDYGMGGAVRMAAEAAMRVGAGLVSVATRPEHMPIVSGCRPEIMCQQVANYHDLLPLLERATVIVIGPGLGKSDWAESLLNVVLQQNVPKILDADALNLLATHPSQQDNWILTPHPGEAARLLGVTNKEIQQDRFASARQLQERYHGVIVLKGAGSIIQTEATEPAICSAGNPGMATGGMGDILSGIIGGLLAQHMTPKDAAELGVMIHALAADKAAEQGGGERGLLATDLLGYLRELVNPY